MQWILSMAKWQPDIWQKKTQPKGQTVPWFYKLFGKHSCKNFLQKNKQWLTKLQNFEWFSESTQPIIRLSSEVQCTFVTHASLLTSPQSQHKFCPLNHVQKRVILVFMWWRCVSHSLVVFVFPQLKFSISHTFGKHFWKWLERNFKKACSCNASTTSNG